MPGISNLGISHICNSEMWKSKKQTHIKLCLLAVTAYISRSDRCGKFENVQKRFYSETMKFVMVLGNVSSVLKMSLDNMLKYQYQMRPGDRKLITVQEMFFLYSKGFISASDRTSAGMESVRAFHSRFNEFKAWVSSVCANLKATRTKLHKNEARSVRQNLPCAEKILV